MSEPEPVSSAVTTRVLRPGAPHLESVRRLWREHSDTLGYFPSGAFSEAAFDNRIIGAVDRTDELVGYLLFRTPGDRAVIVHLCTSPASRGRGVGRQLLWALRERTKAKRGIGLTCRRDYDANRMWPKLGFTWVRDVPAREKGQFLSQWWLDYQQPDLFSRVPLAVADRLAVALDQNVFFDIHGGADMNRDIESEALVADWVQEELELVVTDEVFNEIGRRDCDAVERERLRRCANSYRRVLPEQANLESVLVSLRGLFPGQMNESTESDLRHVARAVACGVQVFVTRDGELLEMSGELFDRHGLTVIRPSGLVTMLDEVHREHLYQPSRVAGTLLQSRRLSSGDDLERFLGPFHRSAAGETQAAFLAAVRRAQAAPTSSHVEVMGSTQQMVGLTAVEVRDGALVVILLRPARGATATTIARFMAEALIRQAVSKRANSVVVEDRYLDDDVLRTLGEAGFERLETGTWTKRNGYGAHSVDAAPATLGARLGIAPSAEELWNAEHILRPLKFWDLDVPTHVVPILPRWAAELFDAELAGQLLLGAQQDLALRSELAYYRAARPPLANRPGRLLWYVSGSRRRDFVGGGTVRAYSRIDEVVVGRAKDLHRRFRRLGVYQWTDVLGTARGDPNGEIMAIRFSGTELFPRPISWKALQSCLETHGKRSQIQSPTKISAAAFRDIYALGTNHE